MNILEKQFEQWIADHIWAVHKDARLIGTQVQLPHGGILDLLAVCESGEYPDTWETVFLIIEVKKELIDGSAVLQVLNYMGAFKQALRSDDIKTLLGMGEVDPANVRVEGVLAAPNITNEAAHAIVGAGQVLRYFHLDVEIWGRTWDSDVIRPGDVDDGKAIELAKSLTAEILASWSLGRKCAELDKGEPQIEAVLADIDD